MREYLEENILYSVADHDGVPRPAGRGERMREMRRRATIMEGYR